MSSGELVIEGLFAGVPGHDILKGVSLTVHSGQVHAVMGPNGSGKSTLAHVLMGRPGYEVTEGSVTLDGVDLLSLPTWQRARAGLFLGMQHPIEVPGVSLTETLNAGRPEVPADGIGASDGDITTVSSPRHGASGSTPASSSVRSTLTSPGASASATRRCNSACFGPVSRCWTRSTPASTSTGSPLWVDGLRRPPAEWGLGVLAITHFRRLLDVLTPDVVYVLPDGRVVATGDHELAEMVDRSGYTAYA